MHMMVQTMHCLHLSRETASMASNPGGPGAVCWRCALKPLSSNKLRVHASAAPCIIDVATLPDPIHLSRSGNHRVPNSYCCSTPVVPSHTSIVHVGGLRATFKSSNSRAQTRRSFVTGIVGK